jgi:hypothetical protein
MRRSVWPGSAPASCIASSRCPRRGDDVDPEVARELVAQVQALAATVTETFED